MLDLQDTPRNYPLDDVQGMYLSLHNVPSCAMSDRDPL